jgi:hypothetical protein
MTTPHLRRNPAPSPTNGRRVLIGALVFFLILIAAVVIPLVVIGLHNHGVKIPPGPVPHTTQSP